jgi:hypothetical protein
MCASDGVRKCEGGSACARGSRTLSDLDVLHGRIALAHATKRPVIMSVDEAEGYEWWLWHLHRDRRRWLECYLDRPWARFVRRLPLTTRAKVRLGAL